MNKSNQPLLIALTFFVELSCLKYGYLKNANSICYSLASADLVGYGQQTRQCCAGFESMECLCITNLQKLVSLILNVKRHLYMWSTWVHCCLLFKRSIILEVFIEHFCSCLHTCHVLLLF